jgi:hypothetical protein
MITSKTIANGILAITVIVLTALLYFLYQISSVLVYLIVALILTLIGNPVLDFFTRRLKFNHIFDYRDVIHFRDSYIWIYHDVYSLNTISRSKFVAFKYWRYRAADHSISKPNKRFFRKSSY